MTDDALLTPSTRTSLIRHAPGLTNPNWPLCLEADARARGWSDEEIADGEVPWIPLFDHVADRCFEHEVQGHCPCGPLEPCAECEQWVHA